MCGFKAKNAGNNVLLPNFLTQKPCILTFLVVPLTRANLSLWPIQVEIYKIRQISVLYLIRLA